MNCRLLALALCGSLALARGQAYAQAGRAAAPFVGCASDGQTGPVAAPRAPAHLPAAAAGLAYYGSGDLTVLAPAGWHCVGVYGSDGSILFVTPERHTPGDFIDRDATLTGPAVQATFSIGDTSGRFAVARLAARLFPAKRAFVQGVIAEDIEDASHFPIGPYPGDTVTLLGPAEATFRTPPGKTGLGTDSRLRPGADPIEGLARISRDNDATVLDVRLPAELQPLAAAIIAFARMPPRRG